MGAIVEVDDPPGGRGVGPRVEVFAVEVGEEHLSVAWISGNPLLRFSRVQNEPHAKDVAADEANARVLVQTKREPLDTPRGFEQRADTAHLDVVGNTRNVEGNVGEGAPHGGVLEVGAGCRP